MKLKVGQKYISESGERREIVEINISKSRGYEVLTKGESGWSLIDEILNGKKIKLEKGVGYWWIGLDGKGSDGRGIARLITERKINLRPTNAKN